MSKKRGWGSKKTRRDATITTGGDLILESGGDIVIDSDGRVVFEAVKDLDQESQKQRGRIYFLRTVLDK